MLLATHSFFRHHDLQLQLLGLLQSPLLSECRCEVNYAGDGIWVLFAEGTLSHLNDLDKQHFGSLPLFQVP